MEGLNNVRTRAFAIGILLVAVGTAIQAAHKPNLPRKTEKWMEEAAPNKVGKFVFQPSMENPGCSYKSDERTYDLLKPFGVVGRVYSDGTKAIDVLLIAGNDKNSFHDNRVCFQGQGFNIDKEERTDIATDRGNIPATYLTLSHPTHGKTYAVMFFKGPHDQFFPLSKSLTWAMLMEQLKFGTNMDSVFYRFIPQDPSFTQEELTAFIKDYMNAAKDSSKGFY